MKMVFITIDWMKYYVGEGDEERVTPLCGYNFQGVNGIYYGYGEGLEQIELEKIDQEALDQKALENVTVVWVAPNKEGKSCIIGWYKDATVYRTPITEITLDSERIERTYSIVAPMTQSILLPVEERRFEIQTLTPPITYALDEAKMCEIAAYIHQYNGDQMNVVLLPKHLEAKLSINMDYERYFYKADEFLAKDAYAKAIRCFNKAIFEEPEETLGYECKASVLMSLKMYDEAIKLYQKVIELDADNDLAHYALGLLHGLKKDYESSLSYYNTFIERRPKDAHAYSERALVHFLIGDKETALKDIEIAMQIDRDNPAFKNTYKRILKG